MMNITTIENVQYFFSLSITFSASSLIIVSLLEYQPYWLVLALPCQPAFTCSKLTIETLEQGLKYVQSNNAGMLAKKFPNNFR